MTAIINKMIRISLASAGILLTLLLSGCNVYTLRKCPSYVACYENMRSISLIVGSASASDCIIICSGADRPVITCSFLSKGDEKRVYDRLCQKHNDLTFNGYRYILKDFARESVTYNDKDFVSVEITSDTDYDAEHPAGANLADVVRFMSWSPLKYILSGYSKHYRYDRSELSLTFKRAMSVYYSFMNPEVNNTCYPIDKLVKDLRQEDMILLGKDSPEFIAMLCFEKQPTQGGKHNITVKMTADTNEVFKDTIEFTF